MSTSAKSHRHTAASAALLDVSRMAAKAGTIGAQSAESARQLSDMLGSQINPLMNKSDAMGICGEATRLAADTRSDLANAVRSELGERISALLKSPDVRNATESCKKFSKLTEKTQTTAKKHEQGLAKGNLSVAKVTELEAAARTALSAQRDFERPTGAALDQAALTVDLDLLRGAIGMYDSMLSSFLDGHEKCTALLEEHDLKLRGEAKALASAFASEYGDSARAPSLPSDDDEESSSSAADGGSGVDGSDGDDNYKSGNKKRSIAGGASLLHAVAEPSKRKGRALTKRARAARSIKASGDSDTESSDGSSSSSSSSEEDDRARRASARQLVSRELEAQRTRKLETLDALLGSEKLYVKELKKLVESYADSVRKLALDSEKTKVASSDVSLIFGNAAKLSAVHARFRFAIDESLDNFSQASATPPTSGAPLKLRQTVGGMLLSFLAELQPQYLAYVRNYASAAPHVDKMRKESKAFANVLKAIERPEEQATLPNSLALPLRRIRTYGQFAQRLLDATPTSHTADYAALEEACDKFAALDVSLSEQSSSVAALAEVDALGSRISDLPISLSGGSLQLPGEEDVTEPAQGLKHDSTRRLMREGSVKLVLPQESADNVSGADRAKFRTVTVALFSDMLIILAPSRSSVPGILRMRKEAEQFKYLQHIFSCDLILIDGDASDKDVPLAARYVPHTIVVRKTVPEHQKPTTGSLPGFGGSFGGPASNPASPRGPASKTPAQLAAEKSQMMLEGDEPEELILCFETAPEQAEWLAVLQHTAENARKGRTFNVPLDDLMQAERNRGRSVPWFITKITEAIREGKKLDTEGLFRLSGSKNVIQSLRRSVQMGAARGSHFRSADVHTCTGLFKLFFRDMPDPVFTFALYDEWIACVLDNWGDGSDVAGSRRAIAKVAREIVAKLPTFNQFLMAELFALLHDTSSHSAQNKMEPSNLAIVMSTNVLYRKDQGAFDTKDYKTIYTLLEVLTEYYEEIFADVAVRRKEYEAEQSAAAAGELERERVERDEARRARRQGKAAAETEAAEIIKAADERDAEQKRLAKEEKQQRKLARQKELEAEAAAEAAAQLAAAEATRAEKAQRRAARAAAKKEEKDRAEQEAAAQAAAAAAEKQRRREEAERQFEALLAKEKAEIAARQQEALAAEASATGPISDDGPTCAGCSRAIVDGGLVAVDKTWHRDCFVCTKCRSDLGGKFVRGKDDGMPYCSTCFAAKSGAGDCPGCGKPITGQFMRAVGSTWHPECFVCAKCKGSLGGGFFEKEGMPQCKNCVS